MNLQKLRLGQLKPADGATTIGDLHFPKVKLLLPFDGSNGATSTTDNSNANHTVSFNGSADISTAQSKFGGSSLYLPGGSNDWINIAGSSDFNFGTDDFTIEMWIYRTHTAYGFVFETRGGEDTTSTDGIGLYMGSGGNDEIRVAINRSNVVDINQDHQTNDQWQHFAVVREGSTLTLYIDGTARGSGSNSTDFDRSRPFRIGNFHGSSSGGYGFQGYIDDFRVTKGLARYTSNFTPPTSTHSTSAGDVNKHIVVNSDADGVAIGTGGINQTRIAKAWVNFNGTGTVAIRSSYNVSSITDNGTGDYSVVFSTAMADANYCMNMNSGDKASSWGIPIYDGVSNYTTSLCRFLTQGPDDGPNDNVIVCASFFGN